jgi:hypothetical protein
MLIAALADRTSWQLWFLQLSGWPVFLVVVAATIAFMLLASIALTWLASRSVLRSMIYALLALAVLVGLLLVGAALLSRA